LFDKSCTKTTFDLTAPIEAILAAPAAPAATTAFLLMLGALEGLTDEVLLDFAEDDFFVEDVLDFVVDLLVGLLVAVDFFLALVALVDALSEAVCATL
jgi:hypothetical protein